MYLLDTNVYIRHLTEAHKLPERLQTLLNSPDSQLFVSAVVPWEISIKYAKGHLPAGATLLPSYEASLLELNITELSITGKHAMHAGQLPPLHRDPFDRLIIAQAKLESLTILTLDSFFEPYGVAVITR